MKYKNSKYFIHNIDFKIIDEIIAVKKLGFLTDDSKFADKINENDFVLLSANVNHKSIIFAYTNIKEVITDAEKLYSVYGLQKKLVLKGIKFFKRPVENSFLFDGSENFLEISKNDFNSIKPNSNDLSKHVPLYLKEIRIFSNRYLINKSEEFLNFIIGDFSDIEISPKLKNEFIHELKEGYGLVRDEFYFNHDDYLRYFCLNISGDSIDILNKNMFVEVNDIASKIIEKVYSDDFIILSTNTDDGIYFIKWGTVDYNLYNNYSGTV